MQNKNLVLVGFMGSGKSTVSSMLSNILGMERISTDDCIEKIEGRTIADIFQGSGEEYFRAIEEKVVQDLAMQDNKVIDCGGGVILNPKNLEALKRGGILFYLQASPQCIYKRIKNEKNRPILNVKDILGKIEELLNVREGLYSQADYIIVTDDRSAENIAEEIARIIRSVKSTPRNYSDRKYSIIAYDPIWQQKFEEIAGELKDIFGGAAITIEHVGSTAVPGMAGKPTIDILIFLQDIATADAASNKMQKAGYDALGEYVKAGARLFVREINNVRICNVHVFEHHDSKGQEMITIRDYFRSHPDKVKEYSGLKLQLFAKYPDDYGMYRQYKDAWMQDLVSSIL